MIRLLLAFLALAGSAPLIAAPTFKDRMSKAKSGDYFVIEANKVVTLIAVRSIAPYSLIIEEISAPVQNLPNRSNPCFWTEWVKKRSPGHSSWAMIEIDMTNGKVIECYSFSRGTWMQLSSQENLFSTLLQLPLKEVSKEKRRRIGPPPLNGETDTRQIWEPPFVFEGKKKDNVHFDAFETTWPDDGSELAGKTVSLFFEKEFHFPLPFWVQVEAAHATAQIRTIDAGRNFTSPHRSFPRRVPEFIGSPKKTKIGLTINLKSPKYYREFELYAIDVTAGKRELCPISFSHVDQKEELLTIEVDDEALQSSLQKEHRYTWLLVPVGYSESYTESSKPFTWH